MKHVVLKLQDLFFLAIVLSVFQGIGQKGQLDRATVIAANNYLDTLRVHKNTPGISAAVAVNGKTLWEYGSGFSDLNTKKNALPNTIYRIASVSKLITTAAIAKMAENNTVNFSDDVNDFFQVSNQKVTIKQVLSHTSGIRHYKYNEKTENYPYYDNVVDALDIFINDELEFSPGEKHQYSSYGIDLIGAIVEKASGQAFEKYVQDTILDPLEMRHTFLRKPKNNHPQLSKFYQDNENVIPEIDLSYNIPGGGMYATVQDLVNFGNAFLSDDFISEELKEQLFTNTTLTDGTEIAYGLGWMIEKLKDGSEMYYHDGHMDGPHSILAIYPTYHLSIAIVSNKGSNWGIREALELSCKVLKLDTCPEVVAAPQTDPKLIRQTFQNLSADFQGFIDAIINGKRKELEEIVDDKFKSQTWPDKKTFIDFLITVGNKHELFDVDFSVRGMTEGDKSFVKTLRFQEHYTDKSWYLIYTLQKEKWALTSIDVFD